MAMKGHFGVVCVCVALVAQSAFTQVHGRTFEIDYENSQFLKDGQPYRIVSGSIHYFRVLAADWFDRLWKLRMAGFNTVQTVVEWATHEPRQGEYHFSGNNDLEAFIKTAQRVGLDVILDIGPYIYAERDMGGLPYWLLKQHPDIRLNTSSPAFKRHMDNWMRKELLPRIRPMMYESNGPIIILTVNLIFMKEFLKELGPRTVVYIPYSPMSSLVKGKIPRVYETDDCFVGRNPGWTQRLTKPQCPFIYLVYGGWCDNWGEPHHTVSTKAVVERLEHYLPMNVSVNMLMFHGGTSFGLTSGSSLRDKFRANPTSYDYDALLSEAGDFTDKYLAIRDVMSKYLPVAKGPILRATKKGVYGVINMTAIENVWKVAARLPTVRNRFPLTFEGLDISAGLVIYSSSIPRRILGTVRLNLPSVRDRGYVFMGGRSAGIVTRDQGLTTDLAVRMAPGDTITVVVESQGRISTGFHMDDFKGITSNATLNGHILEGWNMTAIPLTDTSILPDAPLRSLHHPPVTPGTPSGGLTFYIGVFIVPDEDPHPLNTFLRLDGWSKGVAWVNRFCLGRYWPEVGPQVTLYVPWSILKRGQNELLLLELERAPCSSSLPCTASLQDKHVLDGPTST
ncbi:beta-galactosidase-like isoform X2 [Scylla paramamosain]|uniref:beta-galactosidase-like isoform X2 n=1 Tax=Scylla paramamosain TaxID=85552 RepID=UPI0030826DE3